jgi:TRAP-type C4-dicarboxylate transport system substrate-binding protein
MPKAAKTATTSPIASFPSLVSKVVVIPEAVWETLPKKIQQTIAEALAGKNGIHEEVEEISDEPLSVVSDVEAEYRPRTKEELKRDFLEAYKEAKLAQKTGDYSKFPLLSDVIAELKAEHAAEKV